MFSLCVIPRRSPVEIADEWLEIVCAEDDVEKVKCVGAGRRSNVGSFGDALVSSVPM